MENMNLEQLVIYGLRIEETEKQKAFERKALTRKNGLRKEHALYADSTPGQTRDLVARQLGICGKNWERMKYIFLHKSDCKENDYDKWKEGQISTSSLFNSLKKKHNYLEELEITSKLIVEFLYKEPPKTIDEDRFLELALYNHHQKDEIFKTIGQIKQLYISYYENEKNAIENILIQIEKLKAKSKTTN